jgi:16S rRNA processing protein RimM
LTAEPPESQPRAADADSAASLPVGRVGRAHGLDGSFYVTRPRARLLSVGAAVTIAGRTAKIMRLAGTDKRPIVRLEGVGDRPAAEALRGMELSVERREAPALGEGEWWAHELEGCSVLDGQRLIGTVARLIELPSCEALEVLPAEGGEPLLVPMVKDAVRRVEPGARRIEIDADFLDASPPPRRARGAGPSPPEGGERDGGAGAAQG